MKKQNNNSVSRRGFVAGTTALAGSLGFPASSARSLPP